MTPTLAADLEFIAASPLLWLSVTLGLFILSAWFSRRLGKPSWLNPTLLTIAGVVAVLATTGTSYRRYYDGAQFVHFLLGPAVVALAVPLHRHTALIRKSGAAVLGALVIGSVTAILSGALTVRGFGGARELWLSMAPKSATVAISMPVAERVGGIPSLAAVLAISTGISGAVLGSYILTGIGVVSSPARGFAMGLCSHGIATARAFQESEVAGTFAALAMGLNGVTTAVLVPGIVTILDRLL